MDTNLSNVDGERVSPAIEGLQRDILEELTKSGRRSTNDVKYQVLTLAAAGVGTPEITHGCNTVRLWTALGDCYVGDEDSQPVLLVASIWVEIPINNTSLLRFVSATGGAVYLISSN